MASLRPLLFLLPILPCATSNAQSYVWLQRTPPTAPAPRLPNVTWDAARSRVLLVGGLTSPSTGGFTDTWEYDGTTWTQRTPAVSPKSSSQQPCALVYDTVRKRAVYFVPDSTAFIVAVWEWDGTTWAQRAGGTPPSYRAGFACAYDESRQRTVLFGGGNGATPTSDTYEWDGTLWQQRSSGGPIARSGHAMSYDPVRKKVVLFSGTRASGPTYGDVWEWDGTVWYEAFGVSGPAARAYSTMVWDPARGVTVLFGGKHPTSVSPTYNDVWEWNGSTWTQRATGTSPAARYSHGMAFDTVRNRLVVFGGYYYSNNTLGDTWELLTVPSQPASWTPFGLGCAGSAGVPVLGASGSSRPVVGGQLALQLAPLPPSALASVHGLLGASKSAWGSIPLPFDMGLVTMAGCTLYTSVDIAVPLAKSSGAATWTLAIPNDPALAGQSFYQQALVVDPGVNPLGAVMSNAGAGFVGIQ